MSDRGRLSTSPAYPRPDLSCTDTAKQIYRNVTDDMIAYLRSLREHEHQKATAEIQRATAIRDSEARIAAQEARAAESDRARAAAWEAQDLALMDTIVTWDSRIAKREDERHAREVKFSNNMERYVEVRSFLSSGLAFF